ncbi:hypothetical protein [Streptomyces sp. S.PNR 29]|uniref:TolB family protein n=1 Tax=Streptomyces sp. S.PNR 29 TaxID=2973805 RepID=UPI0025B1956C|nr:hypothetical protein [Streptomyces sp. S.PNR 29]MDN0197684.1 hypothetical protein [Streptomyces sp. S.PNR 29]
MRLSCRVAGVAALATACLAAWAAPAGAGTGQGTSGRPGKPDKPYTVRLTQGANGNDSSLEGAISTNGRHVVFESSATNVVPGDTNGVQDVFVRDLRTGRTQRVNLTADGEQAAMEAGSAAISATGRYVVFHSKSPDLIPGQEPGRYGSFYLRDLKTGRLSHVGGALDDHLVLSYGASVSANGRYVVWSAYSRGLGGSQEASVVKDMKTGRIQRLPADRNSSEPYVSDDGNTVVYTDRPSAYRPFPDSKVYVWYRKTGVRQRLDETPDGTPADGKSYAARISADGRYAVFHSTAGNLVPGDPNNGTTEAAAMNVFVRDLRTGELRRIDAPERHDGTTTGAQLSGDHRYLLFSGQRAATEAVTTGVYLTDLRTGRTRTLNVDLAGTPVASFSVGDGALDAHGRTVVFESTAENMAPGPRGAWYDLYARRLR